MKSKVVLLPCGEYDEEKVYTLLKQGLYLVGGVEALIPKDAKILLKPNLLKRAEVEKAVITHPVVVGAFARILRENGYEQIVLADSCGHATTQAVIRGTGMDTYLEKYQIPVFIFVNKMDKENVNFAKVVSDLHIAFGKKVIPFTLALGEGENFKGIIDVLNKKAYEYDGFERKEVEILL